MLNSFIKSIEIKEFFILKHFGNICLVSLGLFFTVHHIKSNFSKN